MGGKGAVMTLAPTEGDMDVKKHINYLLVGYSRFHQKNLKNK
jgi:hypothetical protein